MLNEQFIPVKIHIKEQPAVFQRYGAQWTPTLIVLDPALAGTERYRFEGFLPADDFLAQLEMGLARVAFERGSWADAEERFRRITREYPNTDAAPESLYWAGVARYKATDDAGALAETARQFERAYTDTSWAKRASVWGSR